MCSQLLDGVPMKRLAVLILNYNNREYLAPCLDSLIQSLQSVSHDIWILDNASTDGSAAWAREHYPTIRVLENARNGGFAYGNNRGLEQIGIGQNSATDPTEYEYVLLLNPDTEVHRDALPLMLAYLDQNPRVGVVGPRMIRPDGSLDTGCKRSEPTPWRTLAHLTGLRRLFPKSPVWAGYICGYVKHNETAAVDSVMGACQLMRSSALQKVGLLDEDTFFMYGEDLDHCVRFRHAGWQVVYFPEAGVRHHKGAATRKQSGRMILEFHRAMWAFHQKHYAANMPWLGNLLILVATRGLGWSKWVLNSVSPPDRRHVGSAKIVFGAHDWHTQPDKHR